MAFGDAMLGAAAGNAAANAAAAVAAIERVEQRLARLEQKTQAVYHLCDNVGWILGAWERVGHEGEDVSPRADAQLEKIINLLEEVRGG